MVKWQVFGVYSDAMDAEQTKRDLENVQGLTVKIDTNSFNDDWVVWVKAK